MWVKIDFSKVYTKINGISFSSTKQVIETFDGEYLVIFQLILFQLKNPDINRNYQQTSATPINRVYAEGAHIQKN